MATGVAIFEKVWTKDAASQLYKTGEWLQNELRRVTEGTILQIIGVGSLMTLHVSSRTVHSAAEDIITELRELFFFDMLVWGFFLARRCMISLMMATLKDELETFVEAMQNFPRRDKGWCVNSLDETNPNALFIFSVNVVTTQARLRSSQCRVPYC